MPIKVNGSTVKAVRYNDTGVVKKVYCNGVLVFQDGFTYVITGHTTRYTSPSAQLEVKNQNFTLTVETSAAIVGMHTTTKALYGRTITIEILYMEDFAEWSVTLYADTGDTWTGTVNSLTENGTACTPLGGSIN